MNRLFALLLSTLLLPAAYAFGDDQELLEADQAFALTVRARDADTLEASWKIADGYYMYRDKFRFESLDPALTLKPAVIPPGKKKDDPGFGMVETYNKAVTIVLPIDRRAAGTGNARLRITAQGCNEPVGVCYPPEVKEVTIALPPLKTAGAGSLKDLASLITPAGDREFLPPEEAFALSTQVAGADAVAAHIGIAPGYYLYRDKIKVALVRGDGVKLGKIELPRGEMKNDKTLGRTEILRQSPALAIPLQRAAGGAADIELEISYQGCADHGICYPPEKKRVSLRLPAAGAPAAITPAAVQAPPVKGNGHLSYLLAAFGVGLLLTFTPCVLPMIPILSGVIVRSGDQTLSKLRGGLLSYSYVLGTAVTYTAAGVLAGATGGQLQAYFQNPWAIGTFATVLGVLALSMFGLFELQMPSFIQSKLHYHTHKVRGGTFVGTFILGLVSALIVGACVSPVLMSVLGVAIATQDPVLGGGLMFAMAHGQGMILVAVGVGAGFLLPKAGSWMDRVKQVFGVLLLGVAVYLLGYLPQVPVLLLWSVLLIVTAVFLGATQSLPKDATGWQYLWKGFGTFLLLWGVLALLGGLLGERDILKPLPLGSVAALATGGPATAATVPAAELFHRATALDELEQRMARARADGKPVIVDFYASWCTDCVRMEKTTFLNPQVQAALSGFVLLQADVSANNDASNAIKKKFGVFGPPAVLFFGADGGERKELNFYGYRNASEFLALIGRV